MAQSPPLDLTMIMFNCLRYLTNIEQLENPRLHTAAPDALQLRNSLPIPLLFHREPNLVRLTGFSDVQARARHELHLHSHRHSSAHNTLGFQHFWQIPRQN
jgi:hypothetical protein